MWAGSQSFRLCDGADNSSSDDGVRGAAGGSHPLIQGKGLSVAIYTQVTDVEHEVDGVLTYDRKVRKIDFNRGRAAVLDTIASGNTLN